MAAAALGAEIVFVDESDPQAPPRRGTVWSDGPTSTSVWVALDCDTSTMVAVRKPTRGRPAHLRPDARSARQVTAAAARLHTELGAALPVLESSTHAGTWHLILHRDPACRAIRCVLAPEPVSRTAAAARAVRATAHTPDVCGCVFAGLEPDGSSTL